MKYAPITSVDVEESFSCYKKIQRSNRGHFKFEYLNLYVVSNRFLHQDHSDDSE